MKEAHKIKLGYAPTRRVGFPDPRYAVENGALIRKRVNALCERIGGVELVDIDWLNDEGILFDPMDVEKVARRFRQEEVDAVFMPHCNYGAEEVVGRLGKAVGKPVLLWGPRDDRPPEDLVNRHTDTQCGLFVSSKALQRMGVPFTYIENCWLDDLILDRGFEDFVRTACVVKAWTGIRIGQICLRPREFMCVKVNESELMERFGIEVVPILHVEVMQRVKQILAERRADVETLVAEYGTKANCQAMEAEALVNMAALELAIMDLARQFDCHVMCAECNWSFSYELGVAPCFLFGDLADKGVPTACETDILGAITQALVTAAARGESACFLADLTVRHPDNENAELLWHCGPFPSSLAKDGSQPSIVRCQGNFEIRGGDVTVARLDAIGGKYSFFADEARGTDGPPTKGTYLWVEVDDWVKWEKKFIHGPYIHHVACVHGKYARILHEACKYFGGVDADRA